MLVSHAIEVLQFPSVLPSTPGEVFKLGEGEGAGVGAGRAGGSVGGREAV